MAESTGSSIEPQPESTAEKSTSEKSKITCHLVGLPTVILHRIDLSQYPTANVVNLSPSLKKPLKKLTVNKKKTPEPSKPPIKNPTLPKDIKRIRGKPKRDDFIETKLIKTSKVIKKPKSNNLDKAKLLNAASKAIARAEGGAVKNLLKKTMLQKKSRVVIPSAKKSISPKIISPVKKDKLPKASSKINKTISPKPATKPSPKPTPKSTPKSTPKPAPKPTPKLKKPVTPKPKKQVPPKISVDPLPATLPLDGDISEDEFLYDELIEELENSPFKKTEEVVPDVAPDSVPEKTTNITLKQNVGNKPPTIVKGGIVKKTNLPADLKPITSSNSVVSSVIEQDNNSFTPSAPTPKKRPKPSQYLEESSPAKKSTPWPVSITSPPKEPPVQPPVKIKKKPGPKPKPKTNIANNLSIAPKKSQKVSAASSIAKQQKPPANFYTDIPTPVALETVKPKIGPKQTAKVTPLSKLPIEDDQSDEYTEEETLENLDEPFEILSKLENEDKNSNKVGKESSSDEKTALKPAPSSYDHSKDDEDPHLDLLRILTDDSDDIMPIEPQEPKQNGIHTKTNDTSSDSDSPSKKKSSNLTSGQINSDQTHKHSQVQETSVEDQDPPIRTIYDLMQDISLQYPSWNLHIIPETSAFCIAQVTKGRLGLPTLKKCIELDPNDYNAKVYIHQYHIKRFDGIYDSEESIIALIQEINSIKA